jgi:hypothetical protein
MTNAIIVPGRPDESEHYDPKLPSNSDSHWYPWLKRQLILKDIHAVSIEPPFPFRPRYNDWVVEFERFEITPETILIGHSCGGGFLVRYLSEHKDLQVGKVVLVAPWTNPLEYAVSDTADFFDFVVDPDFPQRTAGTSVYYSEDDEISVVKTVEILKFQVASITYHRFVDRKHFTFEDSGTVEFPELLAEILDEQ